MVIYILLIITSGIFDSEIRHLAIHISTNISILFFTLNIPLVSIIIFVLFFYFINGKEKLQNELLELANTDLLTDIPNRRHFFMHANKDFNRFIRHKQSFSLFMIDIDLFKKFNDNYGHDIGDKVLIEIASLLKKSTREIDLLCRYGGE
ncbi:MAG: GGDEF domain-containing protein [Fluviicola sp.]|nr:GGDEF domain-containing protein [Fluviicola sp.]